MAHIFRLFFYTFRHHQQDQNQQPGNVPGSYAEYVKILYKDGTIRAVFKDTVDNNGNKVHRHIKWPTKEI